MRQTITLLVGAPARPATQNIHATTSTLDGAVPDCPVCDERGSRDVSDVSRRQAASVHVPGQAD